MSGERRGYGHDPEDDDLDVFGFVDHEDPAEDLRDETDGEADDGQESQRTAAPARGAALAGAFGRIRADGARRLGGLGRGRSGSHPAPAAAAGQAHAAASGPAPTAPRAARGARAARPAPVPRRRRGRGWILLLAVAAALVVVLALALRSMLAGADHAEAQGEEVTFTVRPGESLDSVAERLDDEGIVGSTAAVRRAAEAEGAPIGAGDFVLRERMPAAEALAVLQGRDVGAVHYVLVERGQRLTETLEALTESTGLSREELDAAAADPQRYGVPEAADTLEGWLDPGEYRISVDADAEQILDALVRPRLDHLEEQGVSDPDERFRVVTVASLLEAEALPRDYARVAGIIENRLSPDNTETRGLLQIDSSVNYGLGVRSLQFTRAQRADASNPYNTYVHPGLPPGPIGMPSDAAVEATVHPVPSEDYYWVTTDIATGHTEFSRTYEEHRKHQREFQKYCASNPGVC